MPSASSILRKTDKASLSFELQDDGYVARILIAEGTKDLDVGTV